ncbi:Fpg/Nei family DNA glycosylase [Nocardioides daphniae]|uniref:DNA-(apurinic or apyrimidinic site) lyase n=1 Tax=Nocardioides daphniae TaxID=402297 RepID=A0A4P7UD45_9ACTN|nr:DNA-formamidopyrimidine glycosylase family protein [Nocardioides daphniae]QCC77461.1 Fpg/Nei family DNA glycosylase [Nocardioides daphniae]GGD31817.1 endonuclease VIII [Nocardioides daphniae]
MPEGDTVWRAARALETALAGQTLVRSDFRVPDLATVDLAGGLVASSVARGKHLLMRLDHDQQWTLHTHLKMEGAWRTYRPGEPWRRPAHTARVVLETATTTAVGFSLGIVELVPRTRESALLAHLGPDLLGPDWDEQEALARLVADPATPLVQALQDQTLMAGVGNMYSCELCFLAGRSPFTPVGEVEGLPRLVRRAHQVLMLNKERAVQSTTGDLRPGRRTWVYRQRACRRCGGMIEVDQVGKQMQERTTYWCPRCQT